MYITNNNYSIYYNTCVLCVLLTTIGAILLPHKSVRRWECWRHFSHKPGAGWPGLIPTTADCHRWDESTLWYLSSSLVELKLKSLFSYSIILSYLLILTDIRSLFFSCTIQWLWTLKSYDFIWADRCSEHVRSFNVSQFYLSMWKSYEIQLSVVYF